MKRQKEIYAKYMTTRKSYPKHRENTKANPTDHPIGHPTEITANRHQKSGTPKDRKKKRKKKGPPSLVIRKCILNHQESFPIYQISTNPENLVPSVKTLKDFPRPDS